MRHKEIEKFKFHPNCQIILLQPERAIKLDKLFSNLKRNCWPKQFGIFLGLNLQNIPDWDGEIGSLSLGRDSNRLDSWPVAFFGRSKFL